MTAAGGLSEDRWKEKLYLSIQSRADFTPNSVRIVFYVIPNKRAGYDLDNLTKPVLDVMFNVKCKSRFFGALFSCDDSVVRELHVVRHSVSSLENAGIDFEAWS